MATAAFTTVVDRSTGDPVTEAIWDDQIKDNLNQLGGAHRNILTNGGFEVWQRGAGPFTTAVYTADRWQMSVGGLSAMSVTQESTTIDSQGRYSLACAYTHVALSLLIQAVENARDLRGKTISLSVRVRQSVANMVRLRMQDDTSSPTSSTSTTTGSFVTLTLSLAVSATTTFLGVEVHFLATGTAYIDNAMLVIAPSPAPYQPLHPQEDLARCQRYYEVHGGVSGSVAVGGYSAAAANIQQFVPFAVAKGGTPTVTKNGTWALSNCGQPSVSGSSPSGYSIAALVTVLGAAAFATNSADDTITAEYNP